MHLQDSPLNQPAASLFGNFRPGTPDPNFGKNAVSPAGDATHPALRTHGKDQTTARLC